MDETASANNPQEPIILNPGIGQSTNNSSKRSNSRGTLTTLGVLVAGWFFGNLILLAIASITIAFVAGSTGLVKVPLLTERLFDTQTTGQPAIDQNALSNAQEKLNAISRLPEGRSIKSVALDEEELNALLLSQIENSTDFGITDPKIVLGENQFTFTGKLKETNAPVEINGEISVSGLVANLNIISAKFGKVDMPGFVASNLLEGYLSDIGLSLSSSQLPAKSIRISEGLLSLIEVSKNPQ